MAYFWIPSLSSVIFKIGWPELKTGETTFNWYTNIMMSFLWAFSIINYKPAGILFGVLTVPVRKAAALVKVLPDFITVNFKSWCLCLRELIMFLLWVIGPLLFNYVWDHGFHFQYPSAFPFEVFFTFFSVQFRSEILGDAWKRSQTLLSLLMLT